jgi:hypothetical protein
MFIIGTHYFTFGSSRTPEAWRCAQCGGVERFLAKTGMRFITIYFIIPILPISAASTFLQCPHCGARYRQPSSR